MTDPELCTAVDALAQKAPRSKADRMIAGLNNFAVAKKNNEEQPHKDWTQRELCRARLRLESFLE